MFYKSLKIGCILELAHKRVLLAYFQGFPGSSDGKTSAYSAGDLGSIPGLGRSPGEGNGIHSSIFAWKVPWTKEPGRLQSMGLQRVGHD